jgi:hypothetical protein
MAILVAFLLGVVTGIVGTVLSLVVAELWNG